jgi:spore coat polysaccharide biosynthesis predicted glycosyltransferase SpsG
VPARVRFVASAGPTVGRGHLARALSLAEARWPTGVALEFELVGSALSPTEGARAGSAGLERRTAGDPIEPGTVVVLDTPDPASAATRFRSHRLVVFDDSHAFGGDADLVVQPSAPTWEGPGRADRVLAGYAWVPIGASWRRLIGAERPSADRSPLSVLVCFGGSDPHGVTARLGPAIAADHGWSSTVVVGFGYRGPRPADVEIVTDPDDLPARVAAADVVLGSAGTMKFEIAALGRPGLLVAASDDQLTVGPAFAATGAARWLGDGRVIDPTNVHDAVVALLADAPGRAAMRATARSVIDGDGGDRLAAEIAELAG